MRIITSIALGAGLAAPVTAQHDVRAGMVPVSVVPPGPDAIASSVGPGGAPLSLLLAQVCWLEATWSLSDCAAIVFVLERRARRVGSPIAEMAVRYSAIDAGTERAAFARALPDGDEPAWPSHLNSRWRLLREHVEHTLAGRVLNPCRGASQWGARNLPCDVRRAVDAVQAGRWRVVRCTRRTANAYYTEIRR